MCVPKTSELGPGKVSVSVGIRTASGAYETASCESGTITVDGDGAWTATNLPVIYDLPAPAGMLTATVRCP
jgi:hypothetical protein